MAVAPEKSINPELEQYRNSFLRARNEVRDLIAGLGDEEFNWRPAPDRWSVAECLDHLCVIGTLILPKLDEGIQKAEENGWRSEGPFKYGFLGNWFVKAVGPDESSPPRRKFKAPKIYTPTSNHSISRLEKSFTQLQDQFIERVERANGYDLARVKIPSPVTRLLKLSLGQWFGLLAGHQMRHFMQAMEVRRRLEATKQKTG